MFTLLELQHTLVPIFWVNNKHKAKMFIPHACLPLICATFWHELFLCPLLEVKDCWWMWSLGSSLVRRNDCTCAGGETECFSDDVIICISQDCDCQWSGHWARRGSQGIPGDWCWLSTGKTKDRGMPGQSGSWLLLRLRQPFAFTPPLHWSRVFAGEGF